MSGTNDDVNTRKASLVSTDPQPRKGCDKLNAATSLLDYLSSSVSLITGVAFALSLIIGIIFYHVFDSWDLPTAYYFAGQGIIRD
jgi:hypothetical protein